MLKIIKTISLLSLCSAFAQASITHRKNECPATPRAAVLVANLEQLGYQLGRAEVDGKPVQISTEQEFSLSCSFVIRNQRITGNLLYDPNKYFEENSRISPEELLTKFLHCPPGQTVKSYVRFEQS